MVSLKLDSDAVASLFPEGSQARIDLQSAVITNIASRYLKDATNTQIREAVSQSLGDFKLASDEAIKKVCNDFAKSSYSWNNKLQINLLDSTRDEIRNAIIFGVNSEILSLITEQVAIESKKLVELIPEIVTKRMEVNLNCKIEKEVNSRLQARLSAIMLAASGATVEQTV